MVEHDLAKVGVASSSLVSRSRFQTKPRLAGFCFFQADCQSPLHRDCSRYGTIERHPAGWQSGYAADCKSAYAGSIPTSASNCCTMLRNEIPAPAGIFVCIDALRAPWRRARMAKLVDARDLKSLGRKAMWVRSPLRAPISASHAGRARCDAFDSIALGMSTARCDAFHSIAISGMAAARHHFTRRRMRDAGSGQCAHRRHRPGLVGLPLAVEFGRRYDTLGYDIDAARIAALRDGSDRNREVDAGRTRTRRRTCASARSLDDLRDCNVYIVTVPTPIDEHKRPDFSPLIERQPHASAACSSAATW